MIAPVNSDRYGPRTSDQHKRRPHLTHCIEYDAEDKLPSQFSNLNYYLPLSPPRPHHQRERREQAAEALSRVAPLVSRWVERLLAGHDPPLTLAQYLALHAVGKGDLVGSELAR